MTDALAPKWAVITTANPGFTTAQKLAALNALMVAGPNADVPVPTVVALLEGQGVYATFFAYCAHAIATLEAGGTLTGAQQAAANWAAFIATPGISSVQTSVPAVYSMVSTMMSAIASDSASGLTGAIVSSLLALAATQIPWWQANGFSGPITSAYLTAESPQLT